MSRPFAMLVALAFPFIACSQTNPAADAGADSGASALGFVFWPKSPRFIDPFRARAIVASLPFGVTPVGVFVDQPPAYVNGVATGGIGTIPKFSGVVLLMNSPVASPQLKDRPSETCG